MKNLGPSSPRNLIRRPSETLHQFAARLREAFDAGEKAAQWYTAYAELRYRETQEAHDIDNLKQLREDTGL